MIGQRTVHPRRWAAAAGLVAMGLTASCGVRVDSTRTVGTTGGHAQQAASGQVVQASFAKQAAAATSACAPAASRSPPRDRVSRATTSITATGAYDLDAGATQTGRAGLGSLGATSRDGRRRREDVPEAARGLGSTTDKPWMAIGAPASRARTARDAADGPQQMLDELQVGHRRPHGGGPRDHRRRRHHPLPRHGRPVEGLAKGGRARTRGLVGSITMPVDVWVDGQGLLVRQQTLDHGACRVWRTRARRATGVGVA